MPKVIFVDLVWPQGHGYVAAKFLGKESNGVVLSALQINWKGDCHV